MNGLRGKVHIITGGARGMGEATARRLAAEGARLALVDLDGDLAAEVAASLPDAIGISGDVADEGATAEYFARTLAHFGRIDGAHLNAGVGGVWGASLMDTGMDDFDRVVAINLRGVYLGLRAALRHFRTAGHGGAIVTTSSTGGLLGGEWVSPYVGAKHGIIGLTKTAAVNGGPLGVRVNCVAPGLIVTRLTAVNESVVDDAAEARARQIDTVPLGPRRIGGGGRLGRGVPAVGRGVLCQRRDDPGRRRIAGRSSQGAGHRQPAKGARPRRGGCGGSARRVLKAAVRPAV